MRKAVRKNYARALVEAGKEQNNIDTIVKEIESIQKKFYENIEISRFLNDPQINFSIKKETINKVFGELPKGAAINFIYLLIKNKNLNSLDEILDEIKEMIRKENNILEVTALSAIPISGQIKEKIKNVLMDKVNKEIKVNTEIDETLIGGLVIKIGDLIVDGSINGKIQRLKLKIKKL